MAEYTPFGTVVENVDHRTLNKNRDWLTASLKLYEVNYGVLPTEQDLEDYSGDTFADKIADYGLRQMAGFNFNIGDQAIDTYTITQKADQETKEAFVYLIDQYDNVDSSWHTAKQAGWEMATDFTNWIGLGTLGVGTGVGAAAKMATKKAFVEGLKYQTRKEAFEKGTATGIKESAKRVGTVAGVEGAAHGAAYDSMRQNVKIDAGAQEEFDYGSLAGSTAIGFGAGVVLGTGIDVAATKIGQRAAKKKYEKISVELEESANKIIKEHADAKKAEPVTTKDSVDTPQVKPDEVEMKEPTIENPLGKPELKERVNFIMVEGASKEIRTATINSKELRQAIVNDGDEAIDRLLEEIDNLELNQKGWDNFKYEVNVASKLFQEDEARLVKILMRDDLTPQQRETLMADYNLVQRNKSIAKRAADHLNSYSGRQLEVAKRQKILDDGLDGDVEASQKALTHAKKEVLRNTRQKVENGYNRQINKLFDEGTPESIAKALELNGKKNKELIALDAEIESNFSSYDKFNKIVDKYVEASISGVFSPATVMINVAWPMVKTLIYPALDSIIANPASLQKWRRLGKTYWAMFAAREAAAKAFVNAGRFEQTFLTADFARFMDGGIKIGGGKISGNVGGTMRVFPRLLGATDAMVQEFAAAGYLAGDAFDGLLSEGIQLGLKGDKLKKFLDNNIAERIQEGYDKSLTAQKLRPIYEKGKSLGKEGAELEKYVTTEAKKMGAEGLKTLGNKRKVDDLYKQADKLEKAGKKKSAKLKREHAARLEKTNEASLDYVQTLLYKKDFRKYDRKKGQTGFSAIVEDRAKWLEDAHRNHPINKLFFNLFFRTPAWVFQESLRLTPAINMVLPQFRNDLAGVNGLPRQARAQTELAAGFMLMTTVTTMWATGKIKGSPNVDFMMTGEQEVSGLSPLQFSIGDKNVDYRRWEPFRIPMTIWVNALDGYMAKHESDKRLETQDTLSQNAQHAFGIALATTLSAFKDSGLFQGITDTGKAITRTTKALFSPDAESSEKALNIILETGMKKAVMPIPSSFKKGQGIIGGGEMIAPVDYNQRFLASFVPQAESIPRKYDIFGNVRKVDEPWSAFNPFFYTTPEQRRAGRSKKEMIVNDWIAQLESDGYGNFTKPLYKSSKLPDIDLREITTVLDGQEMTVYDAMMRDLNTHNNGRIKQALINRLYGYATSPDSLGSPYDNRFHGTPVEEAAKLISKAKREALERVINRDPNLKQYQQDDTQKQVLNKRGEQAPLAEFLNE